MRVSVITLMGPPVARTMGPGASGQPARNLPIASVAQASGLAPSGLIGYVHGQRKEERHDSSQET